ncbi:HYC_CC_PP family protein [Marinilabilia salmonicolor]
MLRTVTNIIMVALLLISTTGVTISKHYCDHDLISVELSGEHPCCDVEPCCETETEFLQVKNDFVVSASISILPYLFSALLDSVSKEIDVTTPEKRLRSAIPPSFGPIQKMARRLALFQVYRL